MQVQAASPATAASSPVAPSAPPPPRAALSPCPRRRELLLLSASLPLPLPLLAPAAASARGLFRMPPPRLANRYFLVRAGESVYEGQGVVRTNPVSKTSVDSGLSPAGLRQAARAALELQRLGACEDDCWIWPSITQRAYQAAEIIAAANEINRSISPDIKPPPISDGTPNESVADVFVRVTQLMSILETQYSGDTVVIVSPDSDNLSILQAGLIGLDLRRHSSLFFQPGEVRPVDPASIPEYKQPASTVFKCTNPPSCK
uniref:Uncharacterized protein n=1 Tax=Oryza glumipatula TaxID=40148 RepID=A0A0D9YCQ7_9ORYZ